MGPSVGSSFNKNWFFELVDSSNLPTHLFWPNMEYELQMLEVWRFNHQSRVLGQFVIEA